MKTETITVELAGGGSVQLVVNVDFLSIDEEDFRFVRSLVQATRAYQLPPKIQPLPPVAAPAAREISTALSVRGEPKKAARGGRKPAVDYNDVAAFMIEVRDAGGSVQSRIAERWNIPLSTAKNWMARCREQGLVSAPADAGLRVVEDNTTASGPTPKFNGHEVAACYLEALRNNHRPVQHIATQFDVSRDIAAEWVRRSRALGLLPPAHEPQLPEDERRALLDAAKPETVA